MECEICLEEFKTTGFKVPKILHGCGHTFCHECLDKMTKKVNNKPVILCPFDQIQTVRQGGPLRKNFYILSKLDEPTEVPPKVEGPVCPAHPKQSAVLYCKDAVCHEASAIMCSECVSKAPHKGHAHASLDEEHRRRKRKLEETENILEDGKRRLNKVQKLNDDALQGYTRAALKSFKKANTVMLEAAREDAVTWCAKYMEALETLEKAAELHMSAVLKTATGEAKSFLSFNKQASDRLDDCCAALENKKKLGVKELCESSESDSSAEVESATCLLGPRFLSVQVMIPTLPKLPTLPALDSLNVTTTKQFVLQHIGQDEMCKGVHGWISESTRVIVSNDWYVGFESKNVKFAMWKFNEQDQAMNGKKIVILVGDVELATLESIEKTLKTMKTSDVIIAVNKKDLTPAQQKVFTPFGRKKRVTSCYYEKVEELMNHLLGA